LPKLGCVECDISQEIKGRLIAATVSRSASGEYYVSLCCTDVEEKELPKTNCSVTIGVGEHGYIETSEGKRYANHKNLQKTQKQIKKAQKELSRKTRGSQNRERARVRVAELYEKLANQRKDALQKMTTELVRNYDEITVKKQSSGDVASSRGDVSRVEIVTWYEFVRQLEYKCRWYGKTIIKDGEANGAEIHSRTD